MYKGTLLENARKITVKCLATEHRNFKGIPYERVMHGQLAKVLKCV